MKLKFILVAIVALVSMASLAEQPVEVNDTAPRVIRKFKPIAGCPTMNTEYDSIKEELGKRPSDGFFKTLTYVHHYTIRYVAIGVIWYAKGISWVADKAEERGLEGLSLIISFVGNLFFPIILFAVWIFKYRRREHLPMKFRYIVLLPILLYLLAFFLCLFGMSAKACIFVFVLLPFVWFFRGFFWGAAYEATKGVGSGKRSPPILHQINPKNPEEDGGPGTGYWYTSSGEKVWNGDD